MRLLRRHRAPDDRGAVLAVIALSMVALLAMSAIAVDLGRQMLRRREAQAVADVVALDLVRLIDGRTRADLLADPAWGSTLIAAADRNGYPAAKLTPQLGTYDPGTNRFDELLGDDDRPDAVRVQADDTVEFFFGRVVGVNTGGVTRDAVAARVHTAAFSLGSTLAELNTGNSALLNPIMTGLLGGNVNLGAVSYQGLFFANATLLELAAAAGFGTVDELLTSDISLSEFSLLAADVLTNRGDTSSAAIFNSLAAATVNNPDFSLGDIVEASPGAPSSAENVNLNLFQLLMAAAQLANGSNFIDLSTALPPITVPGVGSVTITSRYRVTEAPQIGYGRVGDPTAHAETAQIRVETTASVAVSLLGLTGTVTLPMVLTGAAATGDLSRISCTDSSNPLIDVLTGLDPLSLVITGPIVTLRLGTLPIANVSASANTSPAPASTANVVDIAIQQTKSTPSSGPSFANILNSGNVTVSIVGLTLLTPALIRNALLPLLNPVVDAVTTALIPALNVLGINMGKADVTNLGVNCQPPDLVR